MYMLCNTHNLEMNKMLYSWFVKKKKKVLNKIKKKKIKFIKIKKKIKKKVKKKIKKKKKNKI